MPRRFDNPHGVRARSDSLPAVMEGCFLPRGLEQPVKQVVGEGRVLGQAEVVREHEVHARPAHGRDRPPAAALLEFPLNLGLLLPNERVEKGRSLDDVASPVVLRRKTRLVIGAVVDGARFARLLRIREAAAERAQATRRIPICFSFEPRGPGITMTGLRCPWLLRVTRRWMRPMAGPTRAGAHAVPRGMQMPAALLDVFTRDSWVLRAAFGQGVECASQRSVTRRSSAWCGRQGN